MHRIDAVVVVAVWTFAAWGLCVLDGARGTSASHDGAVGGEIWIDGKPAPPGIVELKLYPKGRDPEPDERIAKCLVGKDGKYKFSSYRDGDGAEPGEYVLSVEMLRIGGPGELYGPDKLKNNFNSPFNEDPRFQVDIIDEKPVEIPLITIDTSELEKQPTAQIRQPCWKEMTTCGNADLSPVRPERHRGLTSPAGQMTAAQRGAARRGDRDGKGSDLCREGIDVSGGHLRLIGFDQPQIRVRPSTL